MERLCDISPFRPSYLNASATLTYFLMDNFYPYFIVLRKFSVIFGIRIPAFNTVQKPNYTCLYSLRTIQGVTNQNAIKARIPKL